MARRKVTNEEVPQKKVRKRRKPMTEEQRAAAAERLAVARAKRQAANPPTYANIHPDVVALDDDHYLSLKKVREWIKHNKEVAAAYAKDDRAGVKGALAKSKYAAGYVANMEAYLRNGDWQDNFYGENREHKMTWRCVAMAYNDDGTPKRTQGVYYSDLGYVYGQEPKEPVEEGLEGLFQ